jgi:hypothetical protein
VKLGSNVSIVSDASILVRDMAGDAATEAASRINPSEDQLRQIDEPAGDNTWHDVPDMSSGNIRHQIKSTVSKKTPVDKGDLEAARDNAQENQGDSQASAIAGASTLKDRASANIPEDQKNKPREARERTKNYLSKKMPQERREQTIWRLKKLVIEIQGHPDCKLPLIPSCQCILTVPQINRPSPLFSTLRRPTEVTLAQ